MSYLFIIKLKKQTYALCWLVRKNIILKVSLKKAERQLHQNASNQFQDLPIGLMDDIYDFLTKFTERLDEVEDLVTCLSGSLV